MRDGRILFCSSSRKEAWILPKGGWESDETMEESALRETFEEAGVLGTLGPVLDEIEYETRKAKKRRLERANLIKTMMEELGGGIASTSGGGGGGASSWDEQHGAQHKAAHINGNGKAAAAVEAVEGAPPNGGGVPPAGNVNPKPPPPNDGSMSPPAAQVALSNAAPIFRIQQLQQLQHAATHGAGAGTDDTASVASVASMASDTSTSCSRARMRLFPLYVSEVSPVAKRGRNGALNQVAICLGIVASIIAGLGVTPTSPSRRWRPMFAGALVPTLLHLLPTEPYAFLTRALKSKRRE